MENIRYSIDELKINKTKIKKLEKDKRTRSYYKKTELSDKSINSNETRQRLSQTQNKNLYSAMSDPVVCGYSLPFGYPVDQIGLPVYPIFHAAPITSYAQKRTSQDLKFIKQNPLIYTHKEESDYTSLPIGNEDFCENERRRRFSDPGVSNVLGSDDNLSSSSTDDDFRYNDRIKNLLNENDKLNSEIQSTKHQLSLLKDDVNILFEFKNSYPTGIVTEIVKELRTAAELREKAVFSRTQQLLKESISNGEKNENNNSPTRQEFDELKCQLNQVIIERDTLFKKMNKLEEFVDHLFQMIRQMPSQINFEQEVLQLRQQLQKAIDINKSVTKDPSHARFSLHKSKIIVNGETHDERDKYDNSLETCDSLTSSVESGSITSPLVTISGPVTDV